jgi:excisionase family DNA binding protein
VSMTKPSILPLAPDPLLSEACAMLGVSRRTLYRLIKTGEVQGFVLAGRRREDVTGEGLVGNGWER